jgi:segregation and condensation protein A
MEETLPKSLYTVKSGSFEGPLELLLNLVESKKLFINEISLASVTDEFLSYARTLPKGNLSELTSFLSVASTLILIKSRSLLPGFLVTKEEEQDIKDLEHRLALYGIIREIGAQLFLSYGISVIHLPPERELFTSVFAPDRKLTTNILAISANDVLSRVPKEEVLPEVRVRKIVTIEEMLFSLTERIAQSAKISFKEWRNSVGGDDHESKKGNVIISFLAMLELVRQGCMDAVQGTEFDDIELTKVTEETV